MQFLQDMTSAPGVVLMPRGNSAWLYEKPVEIITCTRLEAVQDCLNAVQAATDTGYHAAGYLAYEAAPAFDPAFRVHNPLSDLPLLWFGIYETPQELPWPLPNGGAQAIPKVDWRPALSEAEYHRALAQIKEHIARGDTYQVNYTFPLEARLAVDPLQWFCELHARQPVSYGAYLDTGRHQVLSLSPELFLRRQGHTLRSRPMKGTQRRGLWPEEDRQLAEALRESPKDRAENVMIVDMVRNDLGHVSRLGSVNVAELFTVESYPTVWQMTSEVTAQSDAGLFQLFQTLFPPASVTGAPKVETMRIIRALEPRPRGVYCGAVGWIAPGGDLEFNVPIRTMRYDSREQRATYSVGSGVTWDSASDAEFAECLVKGRVLQQARPAFSLLESLRHEQGAYFLLEEHLERLEASARYWDFPCDAEALRQALLDYGENLPETPAKVRLLLHRDGRFDINHSAAAPPRSFKVALARQPIDQNEVFLYHKSTQRVMYTQALAAHPDCDDVLLWNDHGEMTESTMANLVVKLAGQWWTPPICSGLLPGTYRAALLRSGALQERVILKSELKAAEAVALINSVRKWIPIAEMEGM